MPYDSAETIPNLRDYTLPDNSLVNKCLLTSLEDAFALAQSLLLNS
jgi:hypothetical protein